MLKDSTFGFEQYFGPVCSAGIHDVILTCLIRILSFLSLSLSLSLCISLSFPHTPTPKTTETMYLVMAVRCHSFCSNTRWPQGTHVIINSQWSYILIGYLVTLSLLEGHSKCSNALSVPVSPGLLLTTIWWHRVQSIPDPFTLHLNERQPYFVHSNIFHTHYTLGCRLRSLV